MNKIKKILVTLLLPLTLSTIQARQWGKGRVTKVPCHQQGPNECAFYAAIHGLEELLGITFNHENIQRFLHSSKKVVKRTENLESEEIKKIRKKIFSPEQQKRICMVDNIDEAEQSLLIIQDKMTDLSQHFLTGKKVIVILQTRREAQTDDERKNIEHWIMLSVRRTGEQRLHIRVKDSTDPEALRGFSEYAKRGIKAVYKHFKQLLEHDAIERESKKRKQDRLRTTKECDSSHLPIFDFSKPKKINKRDAQLLKNYRTGKRIKRIRRARFDDHFIEQENRGLNDLPELDLINYPTPPRLSMPADEPKKPTRPELPEEPIKQPSLAFEPPMLPKLPIEPTCRYSAWHDMLIEDKKKEERKKKAQRLFKKKRKEEKKEEIDDMPIPRESYDDEIRKWEERARQPRKKKYPYATSKYYEGFKRFENKIAGTHIR